MQNKHKFGYIYKITNIKNNKIYIGQHFSNNINDNYFGSGVAIRNAIKKHGKKNFTKEILEICVPCKYHLNQKEIYYIDKLHSIRPQGYNLSSGGGSSKGFKFSQESKNKLSKSRTEGIKAGNIKIDSSCFHIYVYTTEGIFIGKYFGKTSISKSLNLNKNSIGNALNRGIQLKGFLFYKEPKSFSEYDIYPRMSKGKIEVYNNEHELLSIEDGMVRCSKNYNININTINSCIRRGTSNKGYFFKKLK